MLTEEGKEVQKIVEREIVEREKEYEKSLDQLFEKHQIELREARLEVLQMIEEKVKGMQEGEEIYYKYDLNSRYNQAINDILSLLSSLKEEKG